MRGLKTRSVEHSPLSSLVAALEAMERFKEPISWLAVYMAVRYHHEKLPSLEDARNRLERDLLSPSIEQQVLSMKKEAVISELKDLGLDAAIKLVQDWNWAKEQLKCFHSGINILPMKIHDPWRAYYTMLITYSSLVDADRRDAAKVLERERTKLPGDLVEKYRKVRFGNAADPMAEIRECLFREVSSIEPEGNLYAVVASTGSGKTLSGFHLALRIRKEGERIVYSLPFINIIEQNFDVLADAISLEIKDPGPEIILKKHHLSLPVPKGDMSLEEALLLADSFDSEVVVTTFVQLLRSLFSNSPSEIRRLHNISNSVIILDEVQSVPAEYWKLIREALIGLIGSTRSKIILMTATLPMLLSEGSRRIEVSKGLSRYVLHYRKDVNSMENLRELLRSLIREKRSMLVVMNTIRTSIDVYRIVKEILSDEGLDETRVYYLSSNVVSVERAGRIEAIRKILKEGGRVICVSTQVIEAGVDLDFETVVRDIAPLDSVIQSAGRCNRHARRGTGEVYLIELDEGKHARWVYGTILVRAAQEVLGNRNTVREDELLDILSDYYKKVEEKVDVEGESSKFVSAIKSLNFNCLSTFSPIKEEPRYPVFIELDERAFQVRQRFERVYNNLRNLLRSDSDLKDIFRAKAELRMTKIDVEGYVVNVRDPGGLPEWLGGMRIVHKDAVDSYYDSETGFKLAEEELIW